MPKVNILLVDDEPRNLLTLEVVLDPLGQNLIRAGSGEEALRLADEETAVILLDVQMQGMDGFETAKLLRSRKKTRHTPVIFLTAYDDNRLSIEQAYSLGAVDYLVKPILPLVLRAKVTGFVKLFKKTREVEAIAERVEVALRDSEQRFRALFELGPIAVYTCDAAGVLQEFNQRAAELWGRTPTLKDTAERFCGAFKLRQLDGSWMPHDQCPMAEVLSGAIAEVHDAEVLIERPDGSRLTVIVNIRPLKNESGEITGALNCFYDITERKRSEELLREANTRKDEFLAMLAHELRNPLAPINNALQILLLTQGKSEAVETATAMMARQVGQVNHLVDDLLDISRINRGKFELRKSRVELASAVNQAVEVAAAMYECMNHELTVTLPPQPIFVHADPTRLAQVVGNLLNNACKFTDKGGRISLTVERQGSEAVIRLRDNGIGIAAEQLSRIFDMFTQIDTSLERSTNGLGIGLTLVKSLVEMHGGTVEAHSAGLGQGTEFTVRLAIMVEAQSPSPSEPIARKRTPAMSRRVLVVDDNRDSATSLAMLLNLGGNQTRTASDGLEAVKVAESFKPDVVIMDIGLPKLDGYEACRLIRQQSWGKDMVLVALTGWGQEEDRRKSKEAGFDEHLVKPVELAVITELLANRPS